MNYKSQSVIEGKSKRKLNALTVIGSSTEQVHASCSGEENKGRGWNSEGSQNDPISYLIETELTPRQVCNSVWSTYYVQALDLPWVTVTIDKALAMLCLVSRGATDMKSYTHTHTTVYIPRGMAEEDRVLWNQLMKETLFGMSVHGGLLSKK